MARAKITINGVDATAATVALGATVLLGNDNEGGEATYAWTILDQPEGTADVLSNAAIANPSLVVNKEGTYELRLVVNALLGTESIQTAAVSVLDARTNERIPAAIETIETGAVKGWALDVNRILARTLHASVDGNVRVAQTPGGLAVGSVVKFAGTAVVNSGSPSSFTVPVIAAALGTAVHNQRLGVIVDGVVPGVVSAGKLVRVRVCNLYENSAAGSPAIGDAVFLSDTGLPALTAGTVPRQIGFVVSVSGGTYRWIVDAGSGIGSGSVPLAAIQQIPAATLLGNNTGGTASPTALSAQAARTLLGGVYLGHIQFSGATSGSGTFPAGTAVVDLDAIGQGGGGGGGGGAGSTGVGAGASSGARMKIRIGTPGTPLASLAYSWTAAAAGGAGGSNSGGDGTAGTDLTVTVNGTTYTFKGGGPGGGMPAPGSAAASAVSSAPAAGTGPGGIPSWGNGESSLITNGASGSGYAGHGGGTPLGAGGAGRKSAGAGNPGDTNGFGGGGGGGVGGNVGGAGAPGGGVMDLWS